MGTLATLPTRRPRLVLIVALIATLVSIALSFRLRPETSIEGLLDPTDPAVSAMGKVLTRFPLVEEMLVLVTLPDAAADAGTLTAFAERLTAASAELRGRNGEPLIAAVRYRPDAEMFDFVQRVVVPNGLSYLDDAAYAEAMTRLSRAGMDEQFARGRAMLAVPGPAAAGLGKALIRDPLRLHEFLLSQVGRLAPGGMRVTPGDAGPPGRTPFFSPDGRSLLIRISGTQPPSRLDFCKEITDAVTKATHDANADRLQVRIAGAYAVAAHNASAIRHDSIVGVNGSVVGILILFALLYRRPLRLFSFAFVPMAAGIAWGFGVFALVHPTFTPLAAVVGGALAGIGIDYFVFFLTHAARRGNGDRAAEIEETLRTLRSALFTAWATSCVGFVAVAWSPVRVLRDFAMLGTLALGGAYLASITVLPAALALFDRRRGQSATPPIAAPIPLTRPIGRWIFRHPVASLVGGCIAVAACVIFSAVGGGSIAPRSDLLSLHPTPNPPLEAQREIAARMQMPPGAVQIYFTAPTPDALLTLAHEVDRRSRAASVVAAGATGSFGLASVLPDPARVAARAASADPSIASRVRSDLLAAATAAGFNASSFEGYATFLERLLAPGHAPTIADLAAYPAVAQTVLPRGANGLDALATEGQCLVFFDNALDARGPRDAAVDALRAAMAGLDGVTVTGMAPIGQRLEASIRRDLPTLVAIAIVLIAIVHAVHFRSIGLALLSIVPTAASGVAVLAFMHATDRPLDIVNMVMVPLLIGIDTDYGILTVNAWKHGRSRRALLRAFPAATSAIITCAGTTLVGFGSLIFVSIPAIASLGWLITVGILACLAATVVLVWPIMFLLADRQPRVAVYSEKMPSSRFR